MKTGVFLLHEPTKKKCEVLSADATGVLIAIHHPREFGQEPTKSRAILTLEEAAVQLQPLPVIDAPETADPQTK